MEEVCGVVKWTLRNPDSSVLKEGKEQVRIPALSGVWLDKLDFAGYNERRIHLEYCFEADGKTVSKNSCLFTPPKHYFFEDPHLQWEKKGNIITIKADAYAKNVEIIGVDGDLWLSDNFFDLEAGERIVEIEAGDATQIRCRSVWDIA